MWSCDETTAKTGHHFVPMTEKQVASFLREKLWATHQLPARVTPTLVTPLAEYRPRRLPDCLSICLFPNNLRLKIYSSDLQKLEKKTYTSSHKQHFSIMVFAEVWVRSPNALVINTFHATTDFEIFNMYNM